MIRDLNQQARQIVIDFLLDDPAPDALFWSVREISKRYGVTEYAAYSIIKILNEEGYLERLPRRRTILQRHVNLSLLGVSLGTIKPAFIWPYWKHDEPGSFIADFAAEIEAISKRRRLSYIEVENPRAWGDPALALRLKASSINTIVAVTPPAAALILFTKLTAQNIPILVIGPVRNGYDELGILTLDGDQEETMRLIMMKLLSQKVKRPLIIGYGENRYCHLERVRGIKAAFPNIEDVEAEGFFTNVGDGYSQIREAEARLKSRRPPDVLIFNDSPLLELAIEMIPGFVERVCQEKFKVAVFDETGLPSRLKHMPLISSALPSKLMANQAMDLLQKLRNGVKPPSRTLVRRQIIWP